MTTRKMLTMAVLVLSLAVASTPSALANEKGTPSVIEEIVAWVEEWLGDTLGDGEPGTQGEDVGHYNYMPPGG